jgi:Ser/Thr protein kinase RdoA (MazF antagonist)
MAEAEHWARERYGLEARGTELPGEIDRNVLLTTATGERMILKAAPSGADRTEIACQVEVLRHLENHSVGGLVQKLVTDDEGADFGLVTSGAGEEVLLRLVTWLAGMPLANLENPTPGLRRDIGRALGRLDLALADFDHPGAHRPLVWDVARLLELHPLLDAVADDLKPLVASGLQAFESRVAPRLAELPQGVIHNDANDYNILVEDRPGGPVLTGLIDFGDMVHTILVAEPAIACAYAMLDNDDPLAARDDLVAGYEDARPLSDLEKDLLPDLIVARLCNSLLMSAQARLADPDDEYLRISERPVAGLLKRLSR